MKSEMNGKANLTKKPILNKILSFWNKYFLTVEKVSKKRTFVEKSVVKITFVEKSVVNLELL